MQTIVPSTRLSEKDKQESYPLPSLKLARAASSSDFIFVYPACPARCVVYYLTGATLHLDGHKLSDSDLDS